MKQSASKGIRQAPSTGPAYILHPSFHEADAEERYSSVNPADYPSSGAAHFSDEMTQAYARAMHYAGFRVATCESDKEKELWKDLYFRFRNAIIEGNRNLIFRAVQRWSPRADRVDDMIGACQIVFVQAVAAYNPWIGVRFSTYVFTCLMRALSRLGKQMGRDRLSTSLSLDSFQEEGAENACIEEPINVKLQRVLAFLQDGNSLLSSREKAVIIRRFNLKGGSQCQTLAQVGEEIGLSKERVRQLQNGALGKIREALGSRADLL